MRLKIILHQLFQQRLYLLSIFGGLYLLALVFGFYLFSSSKIAAVFLIIVIPLLVLETILRGLLRFTYGRDYRYSLYNYFLIDDPIYGNRFRPNTSAPEINFLICDKYVFQNTAIDNLDLATNKQQRIRFSINSRSFRGPEFSSQKSPGTIRIFCLGGSTTAGNWVDDNETWPAFLEKYLRQHGQQVEVINAGVQGWYSYQDLLRFKNEIVNYEPDLIILKQGWNEEFIYSSQNLGKWWRPRVARHFMEEKYLFCPPNRFFSDTHSLLFHFLMRLYFKNFIFDQKMSFANPRRWEMLKRPDYLTAWFDVLAEFAQESATRKIPLYLINAPLLTDFDDTDENRTLYLAKGKLPPLKADYLATAQRRIQKTLKAVASFIPVIDAAAAFQTICGDERLPLFHDNIHPSAEGNRRLAEVVGKNLLKEKPFLPPDIPAFPDKSDLARLRNEIAINDNSIEDFIDERIKRLTNQ